MQCSTPPFPLTWLSRVVKPSPHLARAGHLQSQFTARFSLLAYAIVRYDVFASPPVQVPTHPPRLFNHFDTACTDQGASERAPASTTPSSLFFSSPALSTILVAIIHSLQEPPCCVGLCPAHKYTRSPTHQRCVRLILVYQSLDSGPIDGPLLCDTNLQFPDFSSLHTFSKPKPITKPLPTSRLSSTCRPERGYTPPDRP
jgi:hypothetical protein